MAAEFRIVIIQGVITGLAWVLCWLYLVGGWSALAGGGCAWLPTAYAAVRSRTMSSAMTWRTILSMQAGKMVFMSALFVISFLWLQPLDAVAFFVTFICCQGGFIIGAGLVVPTGVWQPKPRNTSEPSSSGKSCHGH